MGRRPGWRWGAVAVGVLWALPALAGEAEALQEALLRQATVTLDPARCAGVVIDHAPHVATAAHCIQEGEEHLSLALHDGRPAAGRLVAIDRHADVALILLEAPVGVVPLAVAATLPSPGVALLFAGRNERAIPLQHARVARLARCPSLPGVPKALFTTLSGVKGDSGAPVVDEALRVVGLVHGGAACNIATPSVGLLPLMRQAQAQALQCTPRDAERGVGGSGL